jgi:hypothetical protein
MRRKGSVAGKTVYAPQVPATKMEIPIQVGSFLGNVLLIE